MQRFIQPLALLMLTGTLSACFKHGYVVAGAIPRGSANYTRWHDHFLWGLVDSEDDVDLRAVCPEGLAKVESETAFLNGLVGLVTIGIYTPTTDRVYCAANVGSYRSAVQTAGAPAEKVPTRLDK